MSDYPDHVIEDQRLVILRTLNELNGMSNDSVLHDTLKKLGHRVSRDQVKTQMYWLNEQGLIDIESILSTDVATLTSRGVDVADGSIKTPGVKKPRPGA